MLSSVFVPIHQPLHPTIYLFLVFKIIHIGPKYPNNIYSPVETTLSLDQELDVVWPCSMALSFDVRLNVYETKRHADKLGV